MFAGRDGGARHWAIAITLIQTAKLNGVEPMAWLTDVLERIGSGRSNAHDLPTLLPWNWRPIYNPDKQTLIDEIAAWETRRNKDHAKADWQFTTADARVKLKRLYPTL